jgi:hypothetical protein
VPETILILCANLLKRQAGYIHEENPPRKRLGHPSHEFRSSTAEQKEARLSFRIIAKRS